MYLCTYILHCRLFCILLQKMVLSVYEKQRIIFYNSQELLPSQIVSALKVEDIYTTRQTVARFLRRFQQIKTIARKEGAGRPSKITPQVRYIVDQAMKNYDETTATQIHKLISARGISHFLPLFVTIQC